MNSVTLLLILVFVTGMLMILSISLWAWWKLRTTPKRKS